MEDTVCSVRRDVISRSKRELRPCLIDDKVTTGGDIGKLLRTCVLVYEVAVSDSNNKVLPVVSRCGYVNLVHAIQGFVRGGGCISTVQSLIDVVLVSTREIDELEVFTVSSVIVVDSAKLL